MATKTKTSTRKTRSPRKEKFEETRSVAAHTLQLLSSAKMSVFALRCAALEEKLPGSVGLSGFYQEVGDLARRLEKTLAENGLWR